MRMNRMPCRKSKKGQALVEFALIAVFVTLMLTAVSFEVANYSSLAVRVASSTREAGRLFVAEEIAPLAGSQSENQASLYSEVKEKVYNPTLQMIAPADLAKKGTMIVSIIKRYDPNGNTSYNPSNPATGYSEYDPVTESDDTIKVEYQFVYRGTEAPSSWASAYGVQNSVIPSTQLPLSALRVDERAVIVEMYHRIDSIFPSSILKSAKLDVLYDKAIF